MNPLIKYVSIETELRETSVEYRALGDEEKADIISRLLERSNAVDQLIGSLYPESISDKVNIALTTRISFVIKRLFWTMLILLISIFVGFSISTAIGVALLLLTALIFQMYLYTLEVETGIQAINPPLLLYSSLLTLLLMLLVLTSLFVS